MNTQFLIVYLECFLENVFKIFLLTTTLILYHRYYEHIEKGQKCEKKDIQFILAYLASQVLIPNGGRPGVFSNARIQEYQKRTVMKTKGGINIVLQEFLIGDIQKFQKMLKL